MLEKTTTVADLYFSAIKPLPTDKRLRLASMILNDLSALTVVDESDEWTDKDFADATATSWAAFDDGDDVADHA